MATLKRGAHQIDVADAFKGVVDTAVGQIHDDFLNRSAMVIRVDRIRCAKLPRQLEFVLVDVDGDYPAGFGHLRALNSAETDTAEAEHRHSIAGLNLGRIQHCLDARGDAAAQQAHFFQRGVLAYLGHCNFGQHRVFAEG